MKRVYRIFLYTRRCKSKPYSVLLYVCDISYFDVVLYPSSSQILTTPLMVSVLARDTRGRGFDSRPFHFHVTTLGKLFTHMHRQYNLIAVKGR